MPSTVNSSKVFPSHPASGLLSRTAPSAKNSARIVIAIHGNPHARHDFDDRAPDKPDADLSLARTAWPPAGAKSLANRVLLS